MLLLLYLISDVRSKTVEIHNNTKLCDLSTTTNLNPETIRPMLFHTLHVELSKLGWANESGRPISPLTWKNRASINQAEIQLDFSAQVHVVHKKIGLDQTRPLGFKPTHHKRNYVIFVKIISIKNYHLIESYYKKYS
jgi:hypothetical protein